MSPNPPPARISNRYWTFVGVSLFTSLGTQILAFGIAWEAAGTSPALAGVVVAASVAPRVLLPFFSGALADRYGPARVVSIAAIGTALVALSIAVLAPRILDSPVLIVVAALLLGTASAFTIPALGVIPRILVPPSVLTRAMAALTLGQQLVSVLGPTLGGVVVHQFGLRGSALAEAAGASLMAVLALRLRRDTEPHEVDEVDEQQRSKRLLGGVHVVLHNRVLLLLVVSLMALAGFVLPLTSFLVPVLARDRDWSVQEAGVLAGASTLASVIVTTSIVRFNGSRRPGVAAGLGLLTTACSLALVAVIPSAIPAMIAMLGVGAGVSLYVGHVAPIMLTAAPPSHLARVQAVLLVAQSAPLLIVTLVLGGVASSLGASFAALICAIGVGLAAALLLGAPELRGLRRGEIAPSRA